MKKNSLLLILLALAAAAEAQEAPAQKPMGGMELILLFVLPFMFIFYFFFIRPQKKKEKEKLSMLDLMKKGDNITTVGGIMGKVSHINSSDKRPKVTIIIDEKKDIKMKVLKQAIITVNDSSEDKSEE